MPHDNRMVKKATPLAEVTAALRGLRQDVRATEGRLGRKIEGLEDRLARKIDANTKDIGEMISALATKMDAINYGEKIKELEADIKRIKKELMIPA